MNNLAGAGYIWLKADESASGDPELSGSEYRDHHNPSFYSHFSIAFRDI